MKVAVSRETVPGERRVALVPDAVSKLVKSALDVLVERDAGAGSFFGDQDYIAAGARVIDDRAAVLSEADIVLKVQRPEPVEIEIEDEDEDEHEEDEGEIMEVLAARRRWMARFRLSPDQRTAAAHWFEWFGKPGGGLLEWLGWDRRCGFGRATFQEDNLLQSAPRVRIHQHPGEPPVRQRNTHPIQSTMFHLAVRGRDAWHIIDDATSLPEQAPNLHSITGQHFGLPAVIPHRAV